MNRGGIRAEDESALAQVTTEEEDSGDDEESVLVPGKRERTESHGSCVRVLRSPR